MLMWPMGDDDSLDDIPDYDGHVDHLSQESKDEEHAESELWHPQEYPETPEEKINWQEQVPMLHLRSHLNKLLETLRHAQYITDKTREELKKCRYQIRQYEEEREKLSAEIETKESEGNRPAVQRLQATLKRVNNELEAEQKLEGVIKDQLEQAEYELALAEVERGKFILAEDKLLQKEHQLSKDKVQMSMIRLQKEQLLARNAVTSKKQEKRKMQDVLNDAERRHIQAIEEAERSHKRANKYLSKTLAKLKKRQQEEQDRYTSEMARKVDMLLKLKSDIASNRENLRAIWTRDTAAERHKQLAEKEEINKILSEGGNADEILLIKKRKNEVEKKKQQFEAEQKLKRTAIIQKILKEDESFKKRMELQPYLWTDPEQEKALRLCPVKKKPPKVLVDYIAACDDERAKVKATDSGKQKEAEMEDVEEQEEEEVEEEHLEAEAQEPSLGHEVDLTEEEEVEELQVDLAKPEFEGLWGKEAVSYKAYKDADSAPAKPIGGSKMEQEILKKTLNKTREGITITQVAAGKEFSGCPFYSKPKIIHFKDFVVGKSYKKKVILTNVSYTVNYIRFMDITENLKNFIKISFEPPGQMSAGMTCEMTVTFKPEIDEDLNGEVYFLTQTGPFHVPLVCSTKKCDLSLNTTKIDFGTSVIGETLKQSFILTNRGALGASFTFYKVTGIQPQASRTETYLDEQTNTSSPTAEPLVENISSISDQVGDKKASFEVELDVAASPTVVDHLSVAEDNCETKVEAVQLSTHEMNKESEKVPSPILVAKEEEEVASLDGLKVGPLFSGNVGPFSSVVLEIIWHPTIPGEVRSEFVVTFSDPKIEALSIYAVANAIDVPVWIERQTVDLKICMFDRLYQDTVIINNRATIAQKLQFEVCKELRNHLELLPKTGYIQAHSQFSAQLKFLPRQSLFKEAAKFFDTETGVLEAPMIVRVGGQVTPVSFTVQAVVTTSDLEFGVCDIDFGCCTIHESVKQMLKLTNRSILPQQYGFVGLPECLEVQPNDGFGTLLPLETLELDIIFSPKAATEYKMNLLVRSLINRDFSIPCKGVGVLTPLELSQQVIRFRATPLYDTSSAAILVVNNHINANEFSHPVPRIGKGEICPVGPTSFEFKVPEDAPITISPRVGTVLPGQKLRVEIRFSPTLSSDYIKLEVMKMNARQEEEKEEREREEAAKKEKQELENANIGKKKSTSSPKLSVTTSKSKQSSVQTVTEIDNDAASKFDPDRISSDSPIYRTAIASLLQQFKGQFQSVTVPCYVASGLAGNPGELNFSIHNTLYLEVHCPSIRPPVIVISDEGRRTVDFGSVSVGQVCSKQVMIMNISEKDIKMKATALNPSGPFQIQNALRAVSPGATHTLLLTFTPNQDLIFQENLGINTLSSTLHLTLKGCGIRPLVKLSIEDGLFDMKAVLVGEFVEQPFMIENCSPLAVNYTIRLDSLSHLRHNKAQMLPPFLGAQESHGTRNYVGPQNKSGRSVFDIVPFAGSVDAGETKEVIVTFAPDHETDLFSDGVRVDLFGQNCSPKEQESHFFQVTGQGKSQVMFLEGCDPLESPMKSLAYFSKPGQDEELSGPPVQSALITIRSVMKGNYFEPGVRNIFIGCVRTMSSTQKKNGDFTVDGIQSLLQKGFTVQPQKGSVEPNSKAVIEITWIPPANYDQNNVVEETMNLTLKGDVTEQIPLVIRAMIVSE